MATTSHTRKAESPATTSSCCAPLVRLPAESELDRTAKMLKALSHPVRLKMMHLLSQSSGQVCVCDVEAQFELAQPTISHHLRLLREAGLVESEQRGQWVYPRIRGAALTSLASHLSDLNV